MIAIIDYGAGNIGSVKNALDRLNVDSIVTNDPATIKSAEKVILPGVGEASSAMKTLQELELDEVIKELKQPVLGVCLGLQLMCRWSEEGDCKGLGIFDVNVLRFPAELLVPHMGWNNCEISSNPLMKGITNTDDFYFVHSFYAERGNETIATCNYIRPFSAAMNKNNFYATQFHPEKSADIGTKLLQNFIEL